MRATTRPYCQLLSAVCVDALLGEVDDSLTMPAGGGLLDERLADVRKTAEADFARAIGAMDVASRAVAPEIFAPAWRDAAAALRAVLT